MCNTSYEFWAGVFTSAGDSAPHLHRAEAGERHRVSCPFSKVWMVRWEVQSLSIDLVLKKIGDLPNRGLKA